jgi:hypothetical protein
MTPATNAVAIAIFDFIERRFPQVFWLLLGLPVGGGSNVFCSQLRENFRRQTNHNQGAGQGRRKDADYEVAAKSAAIPLNLMPINPAHAARWELHQSLIYF